MAVPPIVPSHGPLPPPRDRDSAGYRFSPVVKGAADHVVLNREACNGLAPLAVHTWVITATDTFVVKVETPNHEVYAIPESLQSSYAANKVAVLKGRWPSVKIETAGDVHVFADVSAIQVF